MSSSQVYPTLPTTMNSDSLCGDVTSGIVSADWYPSTTVSHEQTIVAPFDVGNDRPLRIISTDHGSTQYAYNDPYLTPFPTTTVPSQPWTQYARASVPDLSMSMYGVQQQQRHAPQQQQHAPSHADPQQQRSLTTPSESKNPSRPRSSPNVPWTTNGLGIDYTTTVTASTPVTSTFSPSVFHNYPADEAFGSASSPELRQPQPRRPYTNIAPNPAGVAAVKRRRDDDDPAETSTTATPKRRKRTSSVASADLSEDDRFLVQLKEDENLPWKDIAARFQSDKSKTFQVAALQMRYKRLREKFRIWEDQDVSALRLAHEYWEKYKWEIISAKMLDFGIHERWPARHCARKWQELETSAVPTTANIPTTGMTPASVSQFSSPVEGPLHFTFMPLQ